MMSSSPERLLTAIHDLLKNHVPQAVFNNGSNTKARDAFSIAAFRINVFVRLDRQRYWPYGADFLSYLFLNEDLSH
jgi:hypothetical protein